jgi:hypothetical protein
MRRKRSKYRNVRTTVGGITFASKREAARWQELQLMQKAGAIIGLRVHEPFAIVVNGENVCTYVSDFTYYQGGLRCVEDVKTKVTMTAVYRLKKKLLRAVHGLEIKEVF